MFESSIVGSYGHAFSQFNQNNFGYLSFVYTPLLLVALYLLYKTEKFTIRHAEISLSIVLLFFMLLILQTLLVKGILSGSLASGFVSFISPFVGVAGVWIFWAMMNALGGIILIDMNLKDLFSKLKPKEKKDVTIKYEPAPKKQVIKKSVKVEKEQSSVDVNTATNEIEINQELIVEKEVVQEIEIKQEKGSQSQMDLIEPSKEAEVVVDKEIKKIEEKVVDLDEKPHATIVEELEENKQFLEQIDKGEQEKPKNFSLPKLEFLAKPSKKSTEINEAAIDDKIEELIEKLAQFKIDGDVIRTYTGPVVSTFEFKPAAHVKVSKILNLSDDLAMALRAKTIRIQAPIPGKDVVGIEIPNDKVDTIYLREVLESKLFQEAASPLTIVMGKDIVGKPFITDLKKLPHLLIAGTTGSGKSVGINSMILSLLYRNSPDQLRLLMIDPKMLEFSIYNDIPHLLTPVITKAAQAITALNNMVYEMERRYVLLSESRTKNIDNYNEKMKKIGGEPLPFIVVIIDELADLMMTSGKDVEYSIARLAQMARASGIHLIVATQRPSVDVVTGLIKANLPSRVSYKVGQKIDSKVILDSMGAESLLGRGDMLFTPPGMSGLVRLHAPWSSEEEIETIVEYIKKQRPPQYDNSFLDVSEDGESGSSTVISEADLDEMYENAKSIVLSDKKTSISYLQRRLQIGYNRAARIVEQLEKKGVLSAPNTKGNREILV